MRMEEGNRRGGGGSKCAAGESRQALGRRQSFASEIVATASSFGESRQKRTKNWEGFLKRTLMRLEAGRWGWEGKSM